ncbi:nuclear export factor GLE1 [Alicyclobacillus hesperidum URH17-3-68]|nr:nuclear export factor GLE1 [Alicyclobacillus hesperidum URH17-3-68]
MMRQRVGKWLATIAGALATLTAASTVFAHVVVIPDNPTPPTAGAWEQYTMRVPCERTDPTVKIVLKMPQGVQFDDYEPVPGWTVSTSQTGGSQIVTWQATGNGISPGQFMEFPFIASNPSTPGDVAWDAYQYYKDGTIVTWTGPTGSATPHSITQIVSADGTAPVISNARSGSTSSTTDANAPTWSAGWTMADTIILTVSIVSILLSGLALAFALRKDSAK